MFERARERRASGKMNYTKSTEKQRSGGVMPLVCPVEDELDHANLLENFQSEQGTPSFYLKTI